MVLSFQGFAPVPGEPYAIRAMNELGIDISGGHPKKADQFVAQPFDYVITVCDNADKNCPYFTGEVGRRMHIGFPDPASAKGTDEEAIDRTGRICRAAASA